MKKTIQVNLSGQIFTLDEDAYDRLSNYLRQISQLYANSPGKDEILQDIEVRIAELFTEKLRETKMVVSLKDVDAVVEVMVRPEQFEEGTMEDESSSSQRQERREEYRAKRFYKDPDDKVVGGVCSCIGYYFGVDPLFIRLAFICAVVFAGTGILLYLILIIILPEAKTASEKWHMKGELVNIGSIGNPLRMK